MQTVQRTTICLSKEVQRQLNELIKIYGERTSRVLARAINELYRKEFYTE